MCFGVDDDVELSVASGDPVLDVLVLAFLLVLLEI